jgi:ribosomal protein S18 acetylase RimI-like enzyme
VAETDAELNDYFDVEGYAVVETLNSYRWDLVNRPVPASQPLDGWELRPVAGEAEAETRRAASHAAFESTMEPSDHLQRYLRFMGSPAYERENDLVAVSPEGRVGSFMVWWPDETGIAQIEPFGTDPDFQRRGVGRALIHEGLARMRDAGMTVCRVVTDDYRPANGFYEAVGFTHDGALRWWRPEGAGVP